MKYEGIRNALTFCDRMGLGGEAMVPAQELRDVLADNKELLDALETALLSHEAAIHSEYDTGGDNALAAEYVAELKPLWEVHKRLSGGL